MHLTGMGFVEEDGKVEYKDKKLVVTNVDEVICKKLAGILGIPDSCVYKIGLFKEHAKQKDFDALWKSLLQICEKERLVLSKPSIDSEICHKVSTQSLSGKIIDFGIQFGHPNNPKDKNIYALVGGDVDIKWLDVPRIDYGNTVVKHQLSPYTEETCIYDLQCGSDYCYYAGECKTMNGNRVIRLVGNGWCETEGFPYDEEMGYPYIMGKTAEKMREAFKAGRIPTFKEVYSGDIRDLVEIEMVK